MKNKIKVVLYLLKKLVGKNRFSSNTYILGDLHGSDRALTEIFRKSNFNYENDTLIFVGDLADSWGEFHLSLEKFLKIKNFSPILGNHDLFLKKYVENDKIDKRWLKMGGEKTIDIIDKNLYVKDLILEYFDKATYYKIIKDKFICHGGFNHKRLITKQRKTTFAINRHLNKVAKYYEKQKLKIKTIYDEKDSIKINEIFIGHSPTKKHKPTFYSNVVNVDTGCGSNGKLTLMNLFTKKYVQSNYSKKLYKN